MQTQARPFLHALFIATVISAAPMTSVAQQPDSATIKERLQAAQEQIDQRVEEARSRAEQARAECKNSGNTNRQVRKGDTSNLTQTQTGNCNTQSAVIGQSK